MDAGRKGAGAGDTEVRPPAYQGAIAEGLTLEETAIRLGLHVRYPRGVVSMAERRAIRKLWRWSAQLTKKLRTYEAAGVFRQ